MKREFLLLSLILVCLQGCSSIPEVDPSGPIARFGTTPTIDGVFEEGEWDDAEIVQAGEYQKFRIKHDSVNLYFALKAGGGDLRFNTDKGLRVLHWSGQLGSAEYKKADSLMQTLDKAFDYQLWGLRNESAEVINETIADYLFENGWAANLASMGHVYQSELVVSFDWLGVNIGSERFVEIPSVRISGGLIISPKDPRKEEIMALSLEERKRQYPSLSWPTDSTPNDPLMMGKSQDTVYVDPLDFGKIWIDLKS